MGAALEGWGVHEIDGLTTEIADHVGGFLGRLGEAAEELGESVELSVIFCFTCGGFFALFESGSVEVDGVVSHLNL